MSDLLIFDQTAVPHVVTTLGTERADFILSQCIDHIDGIVAPASASGGLVAFAAVFETVVSHAHSFPASAAWLISVCRIVI
jgi:hypothetical protein